MKKADIKSWHIIVSVAAIILFFFLRPQEKIDAKSEMKIGNYYFNGGAYDLEKAESAFKRAVAVDPKILWGHYQLARIYLVKKDQEKALLEVNKELEANPENLRALYVRGLIYGYSGELKKSEEDFRRFTFWAPKEWAGYNDLAWILMKEAKYEEAEMVADEGTKEALDGEKNPWLWNNLGLAKLNQKKYKEAKISFKKAKELAESLTADEWRLAYPGNDPAAAAKGLESFLRAVDFNLEKSGVK